MSAAENLPNRQEKRAKHEAPPTTTLGPGPVLVEIYLTTAIPKRALFDGLRAMGFQTAMLAFLEYDADADEDEESESETGRDGMTARFLGKLGRAIVPTSTDVIEWIESSPIGFDVFRPIESLAKAFCVPFVLEPGVEYELRFVARNKSFPDSDAVAEALDDMGGFNVRELISLRPDLLSKLEEEERDAYSVWYGRAKWEGMMSAITPEDPFFFADMKKLPRHVHEIRHVEKKRA